LQRAEINHYTALGFDRDCTDAPIRATYRFLAQPRARRPGIGGVRPGFLRVQIPFERGKVIRIVGEGLPKARGGRGDLLVRIIYRPEVRITRAARS